MNVFEEYRRAAEAVRHELGRLLAPAGLVVEAARPDGDGWTVRLARSAEGEAEAATGRRPEGWMGSARPAPERAAPVPAAHRAFGASPERQGGESLTAMLRRTGAGLRIAQDPGPGGLHGEPPAAVERLRWLAATLVGDTVLALRHTGEAEDDPAALAELQRQLRLFLRESERAGGTEGTAPFLAALDAWMPPGFPRGEAFLATAEVPNA